jgi:hypothetical protein
MVPFTILGGLPLLIHIELYEGVRVGDLKIEESEVLCTNSTALLVMLPTNNDANSNVGISRRL